MISDDVLKEMIEAAPHITCLFLLPVGYADVLPEEKFVKELNEMVFYDQ